MSSLVKYFRKKYQFIDSDCNDLCYKLIFVGNGSYLKYIKYIKLSETLSFILDRKIGF